MGLKFAASRKRDTVLRLASIALDETLARDLGEQVIAAAQLYAAELERGVGFADRRGGREFVRADEQAHELGRVSVHDQGAGVRGDDPVVLSLDAVMASFARHVVFIFENRAATSKTTEFLWARVAGDALDLAALGRVFAANRKHRGKAATAIASVAGVTALDVDCASRRRAA